MSKRIEEPDYDITDTQKFRLDIWQRLTRMETNLNGVKPAVCKAVVFANLKLLWGAFAGIMSVLLYLVFR